jgi:hypothetical protein
MARQLHGDDQILRHKVLIEINEDFHRSDFVVLSLQFPLLKELMAACKEEDDVRRQLASAAVMKVAGTEVGRQKLIENSYLTDIALLLRDPVPQIRCNAYQTFMHTAEFRAGCEAVVKNELLPLLVDLLHEEKELHIIALGLDLLKLLCEAQDASDILLKTNVLGILNTHLQSPAPAVRCKATLNISALSNKLEGKKAIILCTLDSLT